MNKPSQIRPHDVLQSWMINTVYHLLARNNEKRGGLINFLPLKKKSGEAVIREWGLIWEGRELNRGFTVCFICTTWLIFLPTSGQSEVLNNKKCYVKDAPEVSPLTAGFCPCTQKLELSTKQVPCRSAAEEVSCEWLHYTISSTDLKLNQKLHHSLWDRFYSNNIAKA